MKKGQEVIINGNKATYDFSEDQLSLLINDYYRTLGRCVVAKFIYYYKGEEARFRCETVEGKRDLRTNAKLRFEGKLSFEDIKKIVKQELESDGAKLVDFVSMALVESEGKAGKKKRTIVDRKFTVTEIGSGKTYHRIKKLQMRELD
jgi:hypothetical protein